MYYFGADAKTRAYIEAAQRERAKFLAGMWAAVFGRQGHTT